MIALCLFPKGGMGLELPAHPTDGPGHCSAGNPIPVGMNCSWEEELGLGAEPEALAELTQNPLWASHTGGHKMWGDGEKRGGQRCQREHRAGRGLEMSPAPLCCSGQGQLPGLADVLKTSSQGPSHVPEGTETAPSGVSSQRCSPCHHPMGFPRFLPGFLPILRLLNFPSKQEVVFVILLCFWGVPGHCQENCYSHF